MKMRAWISHFHAGRRAKRAHGAFCENNESMSGYFRAWVASKNLLMDVLLNKKSYWRCFNSLSRMAEQKFNFGRMSWMFSSSLWDYPSSIRSVICRLDAIERTTTRRFRNAKTVNSWSSVEVAEKSRVFDHPRL